MRADRLLSILMLLQARGRMTARALAQELEVSERTIYRDMDALSVAGVPVYTERGPGGGCQLIEDYQTRLTGLTDSEVQALAMLQTPRPLQELGLGAPLRAAMLKVLASLPDARRDDDARVRLHVDPEPWSAEERPAVPLLSMVYEALVQQRRLRISRLAPFGSAVVRVVDPYGLVAKAGRWYLVCGDGGHTQTRRIDHLLEATPLDEPAIVPPDFDLAAHWERSWRALMRERPVYWVELRAQEALLPTLRRAFPGQREALDACQSDEGWCTIRLPFGSLYAARERILGWGGAAVVLAPEALRATVADFARQTAARYA